MVWWLWRPLAFWYFRLTVEGEEYLPERGGFILAANHASLLDPILIALVLRRPVHFLAKQELFRLPLFGWLLRRVHAIPLDRGRPDRAALRTAVERLKQGNVIGIFPEGTRSDDGQLQALRGGAALIALQAQVPIVPAVVEGSWRVWPRGRWWPRRGAIRVRFGAAVSPEFISRPVSGTAERFHPVNRRAVEALSMGLAQAMQSLFTH